MITHLLPKIYKHLEKEYPREACGLITLNSKEVDWVPIKNISENADNFEMDSKEFRDFIDDASIVSDAVTLKAAENLLLLTAGDTGRKVDIELKQGSDILVSMNIKEPASSIYSVEYLKKMAKAASFADSVTVNFSSDYPLRLDFKALDQAQMSFILAPRIENK